MHTFYFYSATFLQYVLLLVTFYEHSFAKMLPTQNYELRCCFGSLNQSGGSINSNDIRVRVWQQH